MKLKDEIKLEARWTTETFKSVVAVQRLAPSMCYSKIISQKKGFHDFTSMYLVSD